MKVEKLLTGLFVGFVNVRLVVSSAKTRTTTSVFKWSINFIRFKKLRRNFLEKEGAGSEKKKTCFTCGQEGNFSWDKKCPALAEFAEVTKAVGVVHLNKSPKLAGAQEVVDVDVHADAGDHARRISSQRATVQYLSDKHNKAPNMHLQCKTGSEVAVWWP